MINRKKKDEWPDKTRVTLEAAATPLGQRLRRTNGGSVSRVRAGSGVGQGYKKTQVRGGGQSASIRQAIVFVVGVGGFVHQSDSLSTTFVRGVPVLSSHTSRHTLLPLEDAPGQ